MIPSGGTKKVSFYHAIAVVLAITRTVSSTGDKKEKKNSVNKNYEIKSIQGKKAGHIITPYTIIFSWHSTLTIVTLGIRHRRKSS